MKLKLYLPLLFALSISSCGNSRMLPNEVSFELDNFNITNLHTELQTTLLSQDNPSYYVETHQNTFVSEDIKDKPQPYEFNFEVYTDTGDTADYYEIELSNDNFETSFKLRSSEKKFKLSNLEKGKYQYKVKAVYADKEFTAYSKEINVISPAPRIIDVDGVINVRDLGGWDIGENRIYNQGLIYRTAQFNYDPEYHSPIISAPTEKGLETLNEELKIKTEIDLRRDSETNGITSSPLGDEVNYVHIPLEFGGKNIFTVENNKNYIKQFFEVLADVSNYPIAFHCVRGTDRTGALAYALGALVGMNEADLMMDYILSNLSNIGSLIYSSSITKSGFYVQGIKESEGDTLSIKAKNYLMTNTGVSEETLNSIIDILVDTL